MVHLPHGSQAEAGPQPCPCHGRWLDSLSAGTSSQAPHIPSLQGRCRDQSPACEQTGCPKHGTGQSFLECGLHCTLTAARAGSWVPLHSPLIRLAAQPVVTGASSSSVHCYACPGSTSSQLWAYSSPSLSVRAQQVPPMGDGGALKMGYFQARRWGEGRPTRGGKAPGVGEHGEPLLPLGPVGRH